LIKKNSHVQAQHFQAPGSPTKLMNINAKQDKMFLNQTNSIVQATSSGVNFQSTPPTSQDESNFSDATYVTLKVLSDLSRTEPKVTVLTLGKKPPKALKKKHLKKHLKKWPEWFKTTA